MTAAQEAGHTAPAIPKAAAEKGEKHENSDQHRQLLR